MFINCILSFLCIRNPLGAIQNKACTKVLGIIIIITDLTRSLTRKIFPPTEDLPHWASETDHHRDGHMIPWLVLFLFIWIRLLPSLLQTITLDPFKRHRNSLPILSKKLWVHSSLCSAPRHFLLACFLSTFLCCYNCSDNKIRIITNNIIIILLTPELQFSLENLPRGFLWTCFIHSFFFSAGECVLSGWVSNFRVLTTNESLFGWNGSLILE